MSVPRTSSFQLYVAQHYGWFVCVGDKIGRLRYRMEFLYDDESQSFLRNCSFYIVPSQNCSVQAKYHKNITRTHPGILQALALPQGHIRIDSGLLG